MNASKLNYNRSLKTFARQLRKNGTKGEALLWKKVLRARQMEGYQFNRQLPIGNYIVDFVCRKLHLIIEVDGSSHLTKAAADKVRQDFLQAEGFTVLRVKESEVVFRIDDVIRDIHDTVMILQNQDQTG